jgi:hypothetical protein
LSDPMVGLALQDGSNYATNLLVWSLPRALAGMSYFQARGLAGTNYF